MFPDPQPSKGDERDLSDEVARHRMALNRGQQLLKVVRGRKLSGKHQLTPIDDFRILPDWRPLVQNSEGVLRDQEASHEIGHDRLRRRQRQAGRTQALEAAPNAAERRAFRKG